MEKRPEEKKKVEEEQINMADLYSTMIKLDKQLQKGNFRKWTQ